MDDVKNVKDLSDDDLRDWNNQKRAFEEMLRRLEGEGKCLNVFHDLAFALFHDRMD